MKKRKIIITILLLVIITTVIGITYAYWTAGIINPETGESIVVTGGEMRIHYDGMDSKIEATGIFPGDTPIGSKEFTVTGTTTVDLTMPYSIYINVSSNTFSDNAISYRLVSENVDDNGTIIESITVHQGILNGSSRIFLGDGSFTLGNNKVHRYVLTLYWLETEEDQSADLGKEIEANIDIEAGSGEGRTGTVSFTSTETTINGIFEVSHENMVEKVEYSLDGINWQESSLFEGLNPASDYQLYVRVYLRAGEIYNFDPIEAHTTGVPTPTIESIIGYEGLNDWYISDVDILINPNITGTTQILTQYSFNNGELWITSTELNITAEGIHTILYRNVNPRTNETSEKSLAIKLVKTGPTPMVVEKTYNINNIEVAIVFGGLEFIAPPVEYKYYLNDELIHTTTERNYTFINLTPGTQYTVKIEAVNEAGLITVYEGEVGSTDIPILNPVLSSVETSSTIVASIIVNDSQFVTKYEYRLNDGVWQESNVFNGLISASTYTLHGRITNVNDEIIEAESIIVHTRGVPTPTGTVTSGTRGTGGDWYISDVTYTINPNQIGNTNIITEYSIDNGSTWMQETLVNLTGQATHNILYRNINEVTGDISNNQSTQIRIFIIEGTPVLTASWPSTTQIRVDVSGVTANVRQYRYLINNSVVQDWTTSVNYTFTGLTQGTGYQIMVESRDQQSGNLGNDKLATISTSRNRTHTAGDVTTGCPTTSHTFPAEGLFSALIINSPTCVNQNQTRTRAATRTCQRQTQTSSRTSFTETQNRTRTRSNTVADTVTRTCTTGMPGQCWDGCPNPQTGQMRDHCTATPTTLCRTTTNACLCLTSCAGQTITTIVNRRCGTWSTWSGYSAWTTNACTAISDSNCVASTSSGTVTDTQRECNTRISCPDWPAYGVWSNSANNTCALNTNPDCPTTTGQAHTRTNCQTLTQDPTWNATTPAWSGWTTATCTPTSWGACSTANTPTTPQPTRRECESRTLSTPTWAGVQLPAQTTY